MISCFAACWGYRSVIASVLILSGGAMAAEAKPNVKVSSIHPEWAVCGATPGVKMSLKIELGNMTQESLVVGRVAVAQERIYRKDEKGKLVLVETTRTPDEFVATDAVATDPSERFAAIQEKELSTNAVEAFTTIHYAYISSSHIQYAGDTASVIASFHITNGRRDGSASDYWSGPVTVNLPRICK
jgi:hypothetical protein